MKDQINLSKQKLFSFFLLFICLIQTSCTNDKNKPDSHKKNTEYNVAAYIWPSCHHDERFGDMLWPDKEGEWEVIRKGTRRFEGHYQPKIPLWGYEPDDSPAVMEKWIDAATKHGVNTFIFDWYWFGEGPFLESSLNNGFLKAKNRDEMQFYVMWANHDVKRNYWNVHKYKEDNSLLWDGAIDWENFKIIVERVISKYFSQPNYFKIEGKPVFLLYNIKNLLEGLGGIDEAQKAIEYLRTKAIEAGFPGVHLQVIGNGRPSDSLLSNIKKLGANSVTKYNWGGPHPEDYIVWAEQAMDRRELWNKSLDIPFHPNVSIGWDDTPRFPEKGMKDIVHYNKTPEAFAAYLNKAKTYCDEHPEQANLITIFSWNEWIEGGYLLPDVKYGYEYLNKVKEVMSGTYNPYPN